MSVQTFCCLCVVFVYFLSSNLSVFRARGLMLMLVLDGLSDCDCFVVEAAGVTTDCNDGNVSSSGV